jgi:hypothetical protein
MSFLKAILRFIGASASQPKQSTVIEPQPKLKSNWRVWTIKRSTREFRVHVVEPREYNPSGHGEIFRNVLTSLCNPKYSRIDPYEPASVIGIVEHFDLVTFPEAFLPINELVSALAQITYVQSLGCVHVGLRPSEADSHLFSVNELEELINSLSQTPHIIVEDFTDFSSWLSSQAASGQFNVGCVFTIDAQQKVRVCLHPKLVRSVFEISPLPENHMTEADLLTLITLKPEDSELLSITLQPLLCSDALFLQTDRPNCNPLHAVSARSGYFSSTPPDHIDVVSVATCTPHPEIPGPVKYRNWHQLFRNSSEQSSV